MKINQSQQASTKITTPFNLAKSLNQIDHIRAAIVAWMINKHSNWEMRIPLEELKEIMNGMGCIDADIDTVNDELVLKLSRLHTSKAKTINIKKSNPIVRRLNSIVR